VAAYAANIIMGILQGEGQMKYIMKIMIIGTVLNIILDPLFIFVFNLGVAGAAAATTVAQFVALIYGFTPFLRKKVSVRIHWKAANIKLSAIKKILSIGFPQALGMMLMSVSFLFLNRIVMGIDPLALTAFSICGRFDQAVLMPSFALGGALITIMGQNGGRGNYERLLKAWYTALAAGAVSVAAIATVMVVFAPWIFAFFTDIPEVINYAVLQTRVMEYTFIFAMIAIISRSGFQAVGYPLPALVVILLRLLLIAIPAAYIFVYVFDLGIFGVWFGLIGGSFVSVIVAFIWLRTIIKQIISGKREFRKV
jgi:putative MATE family efflux protein